MTRVAVVGGGVSGLVAARDLAGAGCDVTIFEAGPRWGGKLAACTVDGVRLDAGAESVLARRPEAVALMADLGLSGQVVHPTPARPQLFVDGRLRSMPPSLQGVPTDLDQLGDLLTSAGQARAALEPNLPAPPLTGDVAIGDYVDARFGAEVTDRLLEPLLGGVYAGHARQLSFESVAHDLFRRAAEGGPLLAHAQQALRPSGTPVFAGLVDGVSSLVDTLVADLETRGAEVRGSATVRALAREAGGFRLTYGPASEPRSVGFDAVVVATPAAPAGRLLSGLLAGADAYAAIPYASVAVVTLVVRDLCPTSSGLLVPAGELPTIKALTHSSAKWAWVAERARDRWGEGVAVVRASVGRLGEESLLQLPDAALVDRTFAEAAGLPGWEAAALLASTVTRWGGGLPQYAVGHRARIGRLLAEVAGVRGLGLAGAALDGVGIAACVASGTAAAAKVVADLGQAARGMIEDQQPQGSDR